MINLKSKIYVAGHNGITDIFFRKKMALKVFNETSRYDKVISNWLNES